MMHLKTEGQPQPPPLWEKKRIHIVKDNSKPHTNRGTANRKGKASR